MGHELLCQSVLDLHGVPPSPDQVPIDTVPQEPPDDPPALLAPEDVGRSGGPLTGRNTWCGHGPESYGPRGAPGWEFGPVALAPPRHEKVEPGQLVSAERAAMYLGMVAPTEPPVFRRVTFRCIVRVPEESDLCLAWRIAKWLLAVSNGLMDGEPTVHEVDHGRTQTGEPANPHLLIPPVQRTTIGQSILTPMWERGPGRLVRTLPQRRGQP